MPEPLILGDRDRLRIDRIDIVDDGDNPGARILLAKRKDRAVSDKKEQGLTDDQVRETAKQSALEVLKSFFTKSDEPPTPEAVAAKADEITKQVTQVTAENAALAKRVDEQAQELAKMRDAQANAQVIAKVRAWDHLPVQADDFGPLYRKMTTGLSDEEQQQVDKLFSAADAAFDLQPVGLDGEPVLAGGEDLIAPLAKKLQEADPSLTYEQAYAKAMATPDGTRAYAKMRGGR